MAALWLLVLLAASCTYNLDPPALNDLRDRQRALEAQQMQMNEQLADVQKRQAENDAKVRIMWTHGK